MKICSIRSGITYLSRLKYLFTVPLTLLPSTASAAENFTPVPHSAPIPIPDVRLFHSLTTTSIFLTCVVPYAETVSKTSPLQIPSPELYMWCNEKLATLLWRRVAPLCLDIKLKSYGTTPLRPNLANCNVRRFFFLQALKRNMHI